MLEDLSVIYSFKKKRDEENFNYLLERFGKTYDIILHKYLYRRDYILLDLLDQKASFLFECLLKFDKSFDVKFNTYFTKRCIWLCQYINKKEKQNYDIEDFKQSLLIEDNKNSFKLKEFNNFLLKEPDSRVKFIFDKRYGFGINNWKSIGKEINLSRQATTLIHDKIIRKYKNTHE
jgi:hypothetical protein